MPYYLGIDGGGTKTRCLLADETTVLAKAMTGGSNIVRLGEMQAREALHTAIRQACATARISPDQIRAVCIGAAGAARPEIAAKISSILAELISDISFTNIEVVGDTEIALEAAFGAGPGVIAIAGTGSIAYGRDAAGHTARAGGWGFAISDEGSGHWIGRRAISAILNARDQDLETKLTSLVLQAWKLTDLDELVQQANSTPPPDFPRLFPIVLRAADAADAIARDLLADAGAKLANLAAIVVRRLAPHAPVPMLPVATLPVAMLPIAMTGSVFRQSPYVRQVFYNALQTSFPGIDVRQDLADPVEGALARARATRM
ncbi:MAG TPA: BadF/BadG/BcrA/BcrD ATPase family protein [Terriglobales bacterium]|jgi:N-acetylglucosamine kinase-like BadF-type ATPase|nr:BadF/BadG/BcrA/BcrD ATPase family protein [Terriglobales bacterium]